MKKILLLEDNPDAGEIISTLLTKAGIEVILCKDGITAFLTNKNYHNDISLVIFDIQLPQEDGITVVEYMKKVNPNQKFLCISSYSDSHQEKLDSLGVIDVLQKPFYMEELLSKVETALL